MTLVVCVVKLWQSHIGEIFINRIQLHYLKLHNLNHSNIFNMNKLSESLRGPKTDQREEHTAERTFIRGF